MMIYMRMIILITRINDRTDPLLAFPENCGRRRRWRWGGENCFSGILIMIITRWSQNVLQKVLPDIWRLHDDHKCISTLPTEVWCCVSGWQVSGWGGGGGEGREETQLEWAILSPSLSFDIIWHSASLSFDIDQHNCKKLIVGFTNLIMIIAECQMTELGNQNLL